MTDTYGPFLRSERTGMLKKTGRWDEALALSSPRPGSAQAEHHRAEPAREHRPLLHWRAGP